jgi:hypothetical protein
MAYLRSFRLYRRGLVAAALTALSVAGCGGVKLVPVTGHVELSDGTPLADCTVSFIPDVQQGNQYPNMGPAGVTDAQGNFELTTNGQKGAPVGWYKVTVIPGGKTVLGAANTTPNPAPPSPSPEPPRGPGKRRRPPPPPAAEQQPKAVRKFPRKYTSPNQTDLKFQVESGSGPMKANFSLKPD